jgi:imidazolonepropionase
VTDSPNASGSILITDIGLLSTQTERGDIEDAAFVVEGDRIAWVGHRMDAPAADDRVSVSGRSVIPGFVDSHAHLVFVGERSAEFAARMAGQSYSAGGIASTVAATRQATDEALHANVQGLVAELLRSGVTTFEIKSGYGLTGHDEQRSLRIASDFTPETTYLGAHVVPAEFRDDPGGYVDLVTGDMLDTCRDHARWVDVFCDRGAFDGDQARAILSAGIEAGLLPRVHANQLQHGPGVQLAVEMDAASADHCTYLDDADIDALANSQTVATVLPGAEFSTRSPYPDARRMLEAGVTMAIATDCNPGSSFTTSMPWCISMAVREMNMTPSEAVTAATLGGARALRRHDVGRIAQGARADFIILDAPNPTYLAYRPGVNVIGEVWRHGERADANSSTGGVV